MFKATLSHLRPSLKYKRTQDPWDQVLAMRLTVGPRSRRSLDRMSCVHPALLETQVQRGGRVCLK